MLQQMHKLVACNVELNNRALHIVLCLLRLLCLSERVFDCVDRQRHCVFLPVGPLHHRSALSEAA